MNPSKSLRKLLLNCESGERKYKEYEDLLGLEIFEAIEAIGQRIS